MSCGSFTSPRKGQVGLIGLEVLLSIWSLRKAKQDLPGLCYPPNNHNCNADKVQTSWAWVLVTASALGTVDI